MKIYLASDYEQGSSQWLALRIGRPTASNAHKIITEKDGRPTDSLVRKHYLHQLVAERILKEPFTTSIDHLPWVIHGKEREAEARRAYAEIMDVEVVQVGFISTDDGRWGCSPDGLVLTDGVRGGCEIKAPSEVTQVGYLLDGLGKDYKQQVQAQILTANLNWADLFSHNERCPPFRVRSNPDDPYLKKMETALDEFCQELDAAEKTVRALGYFAPAAALVSDADRMADFLISDIDRMRGLQEVLDKEGEDAFVAALGTMPLAQRQRVRDAIEGMKQILRAGA